MSSNSTSPMFDLSALSAAQSVLDNAKNDDPWGVSLIGSFANLLIYSDSARFSLPVSDNKAQYSDNYVVEPSILNTLSDSMGAEIKPVEYSTTDIWQLSEVGIESSISHFDAWARRYKNMLKSFSDFHSSDFIEKHQRIRVKNSFTYEVSRLAEEDTFKKLSQFTDIPIERLLYAYDLSLRMPMYGKFAGENNFYLNHPIRDAFGGSLTKEASDLTKPPVPISFASTFRKHASKMTHQEFVSTIMVLREQVREYGLVGAKAGDFDPEVIREIAANARLPAKLKTEAAVAQIVTTLLSTLVGTAIAGPPGAYAGASISIAGSVWSFSSTLPKSVNNISWLRWALKWDIE